MKSTKFFRWFLRTAWAIGLSLASPAQAETLTLACRYESGAFQGEILSVAVDFGSRTLVWTQRGQDNGRQAAEITERYISVAPVPLTDNSYIPGKRIDRITGVVSFSAPFNGRASAWDSTQFGNPGLVCRPQKGF